MDHIITHLVGTMHDYLNNPPTIRNIVVDCKHDDYEGENLSRRHRAMEKLRKEHATSEVRHALNRWYYDR